MNIRSVQSPSSVVMIRPHHFMVNQQTAADNAFQQQSAGNHDPKKLKEAAYSELTLAAQKLEQFGIKVHIFEGENEDTPDCVFPNNWFSTHAGGHVAVFPMMSPTRRKERRHDVIDFLKSNYRVQDIIDYSGLEHDELYLEGTGAMVLDHIDRVAYAVKSKRTNPVALERFCTHFNYEPMVFEAEDENGISIYHTNVLMCIATSFVMIGLDMIVNADRREEIIKRFTDSGREIIALDNAQISSFAGNAIELQSNTGLILALSSRALNVLTKDQINTIEQSTTLLGLDIPTIELSGGSVRCTLAGIHLSPR